MGPSAPLNLAVGAIDNIDPIARPQKCAAGFFLETTMHLILFVCLLASPDACKIVSVPTEARMPMECMGAANEWLLQHPKYELRWARCGVPEREA